MKIVNDGHSVDMQLYIELKSKFAPIDAIKWMEIFMLWLFMSRENIAM